VAKGAGYPETTNYEIIWLTISTLSKSAFGGTLSDIPKDLLPFSGTMVSWMYLIKSCVVPPSLQTI